MCSFLSHNADVLRGTTGSVEFENYDDRPAVAPWRVAREALELDADAPLPSQDHKESDCAAHVRKADLDGLGVLGLHAAKFLRTRTYEEYASQHPQLPEDRGNAVSRKAAVIRPVENHQWHMDLSRRRETMERSIPST
jgi:hypothetical protein